MSGAKDKSVTLNLLKFCSELIIKCKHRQLVCQNFSPTFRVVVWTWGDGEFSQLVTYFSDYSNTTWVHNYCVFTRCIEDFYSFLLLFFNKKLYLLLNLNTRSLWRKVCIKVACLGIEYTYYTLLSYMLLNELYNIRCWLIFFQTVILTERGKCYHSTLLQNSLFVTKLCNVLFASGIQTTVLRSCKHQDTQTDKVSSKAAHNMWSYISRGRCGHRAGHKRWR